MIANTTYIQSTKLVIVYSFFIDLFSHPLAEELADVLSNFSGSVCKSYQKLASWQLADSQKEKFCRLAVSELIKKACGPAIGGLRKNLRVPTSVFFTVFYLLTNSSPCQHTFARR